MTNNESNKTYVIHVNVSTTEEITQEVIDGFLRRVQLYLVPAEVDVPLWERVE